MTTTKTNFKGMTANEMKMVSEIKDLVICLMSEYEMTFEQRKIYKDILDEITSTEKNIGERDKDSFKNISKWLKDCIKKLNNLKKWSCLNNYPILTKSGRKYWGQTDLFWGCSDFQDKYGLFKVTTEKGLTFPVYRGDFYNIVIPTLSGTICGYPKEGYNTCTFINRNDKIEKVEHVKSLEEIKEEGLTWFGVFDKAFMVYDYSSFYKCSPVLPTKISRFDVK